MRVTNRMTSRNYVRSLNGAFERLSNTQQKIDSGVRIQNLSEDVAAGSRAMRADQQIYKINQQIENISGAKGELETAEGVIGDISKILTETILPKILSAVNMTENGANSAADVQEKQKIIADEIDNLRKQILQFCNTKYSTKFLFGGTNNASAPFTVDKTTGDLEFNGIPVDDIYKDQADGKYYYNDAVNGKTLIPQDKDMYVDVGLGLVLSQGRVDPATAFNVSFSGLDILGIGTTPVDVKDADGNVLETVNASNNIYGLLGQISDALRNGESAKAGALRDHLEDRSDAVMLEWTDLGNRTQFLERQSERMTSEADALENLKTSLLGINDGEEAINLSTANRVLNSTLSYGAQILPMSLLDFLK